MCYYLRIASPLTLSEVRSMLPVGIAADALPVAGLDRYRALLPAAQTVAHVRVGPCSCDLIRPRLPDSRDDERHLRQRYSQLGFPRDRIIRELEKHRRSATPTAPPSGWPAAFADFVAEHARNAGPTIYHLLFQPGEPSTDKVRVLTRTVAEVRAEPGGWLEEGSSVLVLR